MKEYSFSKYHFHDFSNKRIEELKIEIINNQPDYILNVNESDFIEYLFDKYKLQPIEINTSSRKVERLNNIIREIQSNYQRIPYKKELYQFQVSFNFEGTKELFFVKPSSYILTGYDIVVNNNRVSFIIEFDSLNPDVFNNNVESIFNIAFANLQNINNDANRWNTQLKSIISNVFSECKIKRKNENEFFQAIKLNTNANLPKTFSVPSIEKKIKPIPVITNRNFTLEPCLDLNIYRRIIDAINSYGKSLEKKPSLFLNKNEEDLRDQFLLILEFLFEGATASGEAFNKNGKTDILIKNASDSKNLFIAECKIWSGSSKISETINQLFNRYLTWRDTKVAILFFVRNKELTEILIKAKEEIIQHEYFVRENGITDETSLSYIFHIPGDKDREVFLEVMFFHFPNKD